MPSISADHCLAQQATGDPLWQRSGYISAAIEALVKSWGIRFEHIEPRKPQQNACVERFNSTMRYEWLSQYH